MTAAPEPDAIIARMEREGVVPVIVLERAVDARPVAAALAAGGCSLIEITLRTPAAVAAIAALSTDPSVIVGAGTVLNAAQVGAAQAAGARFIVSPGLDATVVAAARSLGLPVLPGVTTATEIQTAWNLGLRLVKFFPAGIAGGAAAVRALAAIFRDMRFMPTGGIREADLPDYLAIPAVIACGGSWLAPSELIAAGDYSEITRRTAAATKIACAARAGHQATTATGDRPRGSAGS
jgi:2-dehydro-3-deoxyphosphogluconate aldolase/(4S)-4-hydroxy-2-oxoglutarate aldolase